MIYFYVIIGWYIIGVISDITGDYLFSGKITLSDIKRSLCWYGFFGLFIFIFLIMGLILHDKK